MAGDLFTAALLGLGAPERTIVAAMRTAASALGGARIEVVRERLAEGLSARRIVVEAPPRAPLPIAEAPGLLETTLRKVDVRGGYAGFAHRALAILCQAERAAHGLARTADPGEAPAVALTVIGTAHTPYVDHAPYQPPAEDRSATAACWIDVRPELAEALAGLGTFSHVYVLSFLERSAGYSLWVRPPWRDDGRRYGLFATRSPDRPSPIGLTRVRLERIEGTRLVTGTLDLYDGTPILDIKPYVQSLDGGPGDACGEAEGGNDGWLAGSDHLEAHRRGIPHAHPGGGLLHEAQDILVDVVGAALALQHLAVDLARVACVAPVRVGGGQTPATSHGRLPVPAPATRAILETYGIPHAEGPIDEELLTPTGAALLGALSPVFVPELPPAVRTSTPGVGLGQHGSSPDRPDALWLRLEGDPPGARGHRTRSLARSSARSTSKSTPGSSTGTSSTRSWRARRRSRAPRSPPRCIRSSRQVPDSSTG
ncbi:MAG: tRNA (N6-threonylcarbamoyladenosine(37)-N6)-methyltransferase TrmO [Deltaproteobacteria bacterium]|nr:tRNA (N6-threonylcarbamoyladenosine(37)-N6)-methyltransferase TrmO [Deltaproteobacteria bacterium]